MGACLTKKASFAAFTTDRCMVRIILCTGAHVHECTAKSLLPSSPSPRLPFTLYPLPFTPYSLPFFCRHAFLRNVEMPAPF